MSMSASISSGTSVAPTLVAPSCPGGEGRVTCGRVGSAAPEPPHTRKDKPKHGSVSTSFLIPDNCL